MVPTFPSPYISEWERNPENAFLTLTYTGTETRTYRLEAELRESEAGLIARATSPPQVADGPTVEIITGADVWSWDVRPTGPELVQTALRSGTIPEGSYELCIRAISPNELQLQEACAVFTTVLPDAPELLYPDDGATVRAIQPTFQWTPVSVPPSMGVLYEFRLVERYEHQTRATALQSNDPVHETLVSSPALVYAADAIPLESGKAYVWQVTALDGAAQPLGPSGLRSPIWQFRVEEDPATVAKADTASPPDTIPLVPSLARITGSASTTVEPTMNGFRFEGTAWLELASPYRVRVRVRLQGLEVQGTEDALVVTGGRAVADIRGSDLGLSLPVGVSLTELTWTPQRGLGGRARLELEGTRMRLDGRLDITAGGVYGTLTAGGDGRPLFSLGEPPVSLEVTRAEVRLPTGGIRLGGSLSLMGEPSGCGVPTAAVENGTWRARVACTPALELAVDGTEGALSTELRAVNGTVSYDLEQGTPDFDLSVDTRVRLTGPAGPLCTTASTVRLQPSGVTVRDARSACPALSDPIDLGWLQVRLQDLRVDRFDLAADGGPDVGLLMDVEASIPALPDVPLPRLEDVSVGTDGIEVGSVAEPVVPVDAGAGGYGLRVARAVTDGFTMDWSDWSAGRAGEAAFNLGASLLLPQLSNAPGCFGTVGGSLESVTLEGGRLTAELSGEPLAQPCMIDLAGGLAEVDLSLDRIGGSLVLEMADSLRLIQAPGVEGEIVLGDPFACEGQPARVPLPEGMGLRPDGRVRGTISGFSPSCPIRVAGVDLWMEQADLTVSGGSDPQVTLSGGARARFAAAGREIQARGSATLELPDVRITQGRLAFQGPDFSYAFPADKPLTTFTIGDATLSPQGLTVDGRYELGTGQCSVPVTFDGFRVGFDGRIAAGRVLFDAGASAEATIGNGGTVAWQVTCAPLSDPLGTGARLELPARVALTAGGLEARGTASARLAYEGRDLASIEADFSGSFALGTDPIAVASGRVDIRETNTPLGYFDRQGFHPNLTALAKNLVPDRLPLPTEQVAYLQLRAPDGSLNVDVQRSGDTVRITTPGQGTAPLVLPALQLGRVDTPAMNVALDLWIDATGAGILDGELRAGVPANRASDFDLSGAGIPLAIDSLIYADDGNGYAFRLAGRPVLPAELGTTSGQVRLTVERTGRMVGRVLVEETGDMDLIPSGAVRLSYDTVALDIDADLPNNRVTWAVDVAGDLAVAPGTGPPYEASASLRASPSGLSFSRISVPQTGGFTYFDVGPVRLGLGDLKIPSITHDPNTGWDFELWVDLSLEIPELDDYQLPPVEDVAISPDSFTIPAFELPNLGQSASPVTLAGFRLKPLAFRMDSLTFDLLGGSPPSDWGMGFDFELSLGSLPSGAPPELQNLTLSVLDASLGTGGFTGTIETRLPQPGIRFPIGGSGMEIELRELSGDLSVASGSQAIDVDAEIAWTPPDLMVCGTSDPTFDLTGNTLTLGGDGRIAGRINNLAQPCPVELGPLTLELTGADLLFAAGGSDQEVTIDATGEARLPGAAPGDTIAATGAIEMDLLAGRITNGSIAIAQPFRLAVPNDAPLFTFLVNQARLDTSGLTLSGGGDLRVGPNPAQSSPSDVSVSFNSLTLGLPTFALEGGTVTFNSAFALDAGIGSGGLQWAVSDTATQPPTQPGLRLTLPLNATLGAAGLEIGGSSGAALAVADSLYPLLTADFQNQFRLAFGPARVDRGRVDLMLSNTRLAWVDSTGFNPDNVAGVLPIPDRLGLPSEDVAYLQLRDSVSDDLLVGTSNEPNGVRLQTQGNETVDLVVPSLQGQQAAAPVFQIALDLLIDPSTNAVKAGTVQVAVADTATQPLLDLARLGVPMEVRRLAYANDGQGYALTLDARLQLPESMDSVRVDFEDLTLDADGLSGEAKLGSYRQSWDPNQGPVVDADVGGLAFEVDGARAVFGQSPTFELEGGLRMALFQGQNQQEPERLPFTADVSTGGVTLTADPSKLPNAKLPLGVATFEPTPIEQNPAVAFTADAQKAELTLRGILRAPSLSSEFEVTIDGLTVGTQGVNAPDISLSVPQEYMQFGLFGAEFTLQDVQNQDAIALSIQNRVLKLTMAGQLDFLDHTAEFTGLEVATDGTVGLASAQLVDESIVVVDSVLEIKALGVANGALTTDLGITVPAPYGDLPEQTLSFSVAPDGTVTGGGTVVLLDESQDVSNAQVNTELVDAHLRYLAAEVDLASQQDPGSVQLVGDLYVQGEAGNRIAIGDRSGNTVTPGLEIGFDGSVTWGAISVARQFEFDFDVLAMTVNRAGVSQSGDDLLVGLGGDLSIDVPVVSGGIGFEKFRVGTDLTPDLSQFRVLQGDLTLANMVSLSLNDFRYEGSPTTIQVTGGGMPQQAGDAIGTQQQSINVQSYISFGGSLGIGNGCGDGNQCIFSGGVKQFQLYRTQGGDVHMVIDSAHIAVQDVITMRADLQYAQSGSEFSVQVGAQALVMNRYGAVLVGAMDNTGPDLSAGMFVAIQAPIPVVPGVLTLEGVGGGFFLNGKQSHIDLVRSYVNVPNLNSGKYGTPVGKFTGLLFADASIISREVVRARTLLTVSEAGMQIDGIAAILSPPNTAMDQAPLRGMMSLAVGWKQGYAEGNFQVVMDYSPIVEADQTVSFYVYGQNAWGIHGQGDITYVKVIGGTSEFMVGPPGFYVSGSQYASFSFWIIDVSAEAEASVWRLNEPSEWGAYLSVMAKAELGPVSGRGRLRGVLIQEGSALPYVYAGADAQGCLGKWCKSASVWAKFSANGVKGGFGNDSELDDAIDRAQDAKDEINGKAEEVANNADQARPQPGDIVVSNSMLTAAYDRLSAMNWWDVSSLFSTIRSREYQVHPHYSQNQDLIDYYFWYGDILAETDAPELEVGNTLAPQTIAEMSDSVTARLNRLQSRQQPVYQRMSNLELEFEDLQQVAEETWPESPVRSASLGPPVATTFTRNDTTYKRLDSGPTFAVDTTAARQAQEDMAQREQETDALRERVWERIQDIRAGFDTLRAATADTSGNASPLEFATLHGDVLEAAQMQYAYHGDFVMRKRDWLGAKLSALRGRENEVRRMITSKTNALEQAAASQSGTQDWLEELARGRARSLSDVMGSDTVIDQFDTEAALATDAEDPWFAEQADSLGIRLWYDLAEVGMSDARQRATAEIDSVQEWASRRLNRLRTQHEELTEDLDALYREQAELAGALYDLYDRFSLWIAADTATLSVSQIASDIGPETTQTPDLGGALQGPTLADRVEQAKSRMGTLLETPSFDKLDVYSSTEGYLVRDFYSWWGTHPSGEEPYEFLFDSRAGSMPVFGLLGMRSNGRVSGRKAYLLAPDTGTTQQSRTVRASLRGGAGYLQTRRVEYVAEFGDTSSWGNQNPVREYGLTADTTPPAWAPSVRITGWSSGTTAWVADSTSLGEATWSSGWDPESSISEFEYAIARTGPASAGPGSSCQFSDTTQAWTSTGGRRKAQLLGLRLSPDSAYWVLVRGRNANDLASDCGVSQRIRYDDTPPTFSGSLNVLQPSDTADPGLTPPSIATLNQRAYEACVDEGSGQFTVNLGGAMEAFEDAVYTGDTVRIRVPTPTASDGESGLGAYYWVVADKPVQRYQGGNGIWTEHDPGRTLWIEGDPLTFRDSFYVSYVAVNRAGLPTEPEVHGPFQPGDPTPPVGPKICGDIGTNGRLRLEFETRGGDPETGRAGYRYRVRTQSGTVVRDWTGSDDFSADSISAGVTVATDSVGTPSSTPFYVDVMLRNGQDMRAYATTGPVQTDASPPPGLSILQAQNQPASGGGTDMILSLDVQNDPESGIDAIRWMLIDKTGSAGQIGAGQLQQVRTGQFTTVLQLPGQLGMQPGNQYMLVLISENGAGLSGPGQHTLFIKQ